MDTLELAKLAETEGRQGLNRWITEHIELFYADSNLIESMDFPLKEASLGAALLFAVIMKKRDLLHSAVALDLEGEKNSNPHLWVSGICHVMMSHILDKVRSAFDTGDVLFGWHSFYCGGGSADTVLLTSFPDFEKTLSSARPGDRFKLASLRQLSGRIATPEPTLAAAREYLQRVPGGEVWVLRTGRRPPKVEILWIGNSDEPAEEYWLHRSEGLYLAPLRGDLEFVDEYFVNAKKPDAQGAVPLGGAY
jgi:hypothetical protein